MELDSDFGALSHLRSALNQCKSNSNCSDTVETASRAAVQCGGLRTPWQYSETRNRKVRLSDYRLEFLSVCGCLADWPFVSCKVQTSAALKVPLTALAQAYSRLCCTRLAVRKLSPCDSLWVLSALCCVSRNSAFRFA